MCFLQLAYNFAFSFSENADSAKQVLCEECSGVATCICHNCDDCAFCESCFVQVRMEENTSLKQSLHMYKNSQFLALIHIN